MGDNKKIQAAFRIAKEQNMYVSFLEKKVDIKNLIVSLQPPKEKGFKPFPSSSGSILWLSTPKTKGTSWYSWASLELPEKVILSSRKIIGFQVNPARLLKVNTKKRFDKFINSYTVRTNMRIVDWEKVSDEYDGIVFVPYKRGWASDKQLWYRGLDADTVIIWASRAVIKRKVLLRTQILTNCIFYGTHNKIEQQRDKRHNYSQSYIKHGSQHYKVKIGLVNNFSA